MGRSWPPVQTVPKEEDDGSDDGADPGDDDADPCKAEGVTDGMTTDEMDERYGARTHKGLRPRKLCSYDHRYKIEDSMATFDASNLLATFEHPLGEVFVTEQMFYQKGLKVFGKYGTEAVVSELGQLHQLTTVSPEHHYDLTPEWKAKALKYLMFLKEKRSGTVKGRGCANGWLQRDYLTKEDTSAPTVSTEALFLTSAVDAHEGRKVISVDVPGAFMQCDIDELIHVKLEGVMAKMMVRIDPDKYGPYLTEENGVPVLYMRLLKALYGTLQAALLFWEDLSGFLIDELGFEVNPYDLCVVNKMIDGKQCTAIWHVDDIKISHVDQSVLDLVAKSLDDWYGKHKPLTVHRGPVHDYLGMTIDYSEPGKVKFIQKDYVDGILEEAPSDFDGTATSPAANHLFRVNDEAEKLDDKRAKVYHHLTTKILYLCKHSQPDFQTAVSFLTTRVTQPDVDDWNKLGRSIKYLRDTKDLWLTLEIDDDFTICWWVDASFAVHHDMRSHTGATMSLGKGSPISLSRKQRLNTKSSMEAKVVGVDDAMLLVIWTQNFM
jgi:hypothetical protein